MRTGSNLINGEWTYDGAGHIPNVNPSDTTDVVAEVPSLGARQVAVAIEGAAAAFPAWRATSPVIRGEILRRAGAVLRRDVDRISDLLRREAGKPIGDARGEVLKSAEFLEYYGGLGRAPIGDVLPDSRPGVASRVVHEPLGVVVAITPWNDPLLTPARKLGPALITGNTVVLKPATDTPLVSQELARALKDAGLPAGVLNTVTGRGGTIGSALMASSEVAAVTFTGSTEVGKSLRGQLAPRGIRLQTEMGGKNATVVMDDAHLDLAVQTVAAASFGGCGQRCTATSRLIVHRAIQDRFLDLLSAVMDGLVIGPTSVPTTTFGPVVSQSQLDSILNAVDLARSEGAKVLRGGDRLTSSPLDRGYYVDPALVLVDSTTTLWREEVFGPVLAITTADTLDDAISLVNDSDYGLSAGIFTGDLKASERFIAEVDTGQVAVNLPTSGWDAHLPFGGFKDSGSLFKEQGTAGLAFYRKLKTIAVRAQ